MTFSPFPWLRLSTVTKNISINNKNKTKKLKNKKKSFPSGTRLKIGLENVAIIGYGSKPLSYLS